MKTFAERLKQARLVASLSQAEVANQLNASISTISRWERGETIPYPFHQRQLSDLLDTNLLLGQKEETEARSFFDGAIPAPQDFIGREEELRQITDLLLSQGKERVFLTGIPGIGKTALATALAHDRHIRSHFAGILWAGLGPSPNLPAILSRWGTLLKVSSLAQITDVEEWLHALRFALDERKVLVILDDAWSAEALFHLDLDTTMLITSRQPRISTYFPARRLFPLRKLAPASSLALLRSACHPLDLEEDLAQVLVRSVDGLPLALRLMGHYLRRQTYTGSPRRVRAAKEALQNTRTRLSLAEPPQPGFHPGLPAETALSLREVIAVSEERLEEEVRHGFYCLAVFPPKYSFDEQAANAVGCSEQALDILVDMGLLETINGHHYSLHQTITDYLCVQQPPSPATRRRFLAYAAVVASQAEENYSLLEQESALLLAALETPYDEEQDRELLAHLFSLTIPLFLNKGWNALGLTLLQRLKQKQPSTVARALLSLREGQLLSEVEPEAAEICFWQAISLFQQEQGQRQEPLEHWLWEAHLYLSRLSANHGQLRKSRQELQAALRLARRGGKQTAEMLRSTFSLAWLLSHTHKRWAMALLEEVYAQMEQIPFSRSLIPVQCSVLNHLAIHYAREDRFEKANALLEEALHLSKPLGLLEIELEADLHFGVIKLLQSRTTDRPDPLLQHASRVFGQVLSRTQEHFVRQRCSALLYLAFVHEQMGQDEQAHRLLTYTIELAKAHRFLGYVLNLCQYPLGQEWILLDTLITQANRGETA